MHKSVVLGNGGIVVFLEVAPFLQVALSLWVKHKPHTGSHHYPHYRIPDVFQSASQL